MNNLPYQAILNNRLRRNAKTEAQHATNDEVTAIYERNAKKNLEFNNNISRYEDMIGYVSGLEGVSALEVIGQAGEYYRAIRFMDWTTGKKFDYCLQNGMWS